MCVFAGASALHALLIVLSALIGGFIAHQYDGTPFPLILGQACMGAAALAIVYAHERHGLFRRPATG